MTKEQEQLTYDLYSNIKLLNFCKKVIGLNLILSNEETRYMFLGSLISADSLVDKHAYKENISTCNFIKNNIKLMKFDDINDEGKILKYINKTLETLSKEFEEKYLK
jgi:hypothetical protein